MAITKVGVIYSLAQKVRRELIIADNDSQYEMFKNNIHANEGWLEIPLDDYNKLSPYEIDRYIADIIGPPSSDKCCIVDKDGSILSFVKGDPSIDVHTDGEVVSIDNVDTEKLQSKLNEIQAFEDARLSEMKLLAERDSI